MKELSLHILDVAENSINAGATLVEIYIKEDHEKKLLSILIKDNGKGINKELLNKIDDPFFTTKENKKIGLGLPLLKDTCKKCEGSFLVESTPNKGTLIKATAKIDHIDLPPLGNMSATIIALILRSEDTDIVYIHKVNNSEFLLDTRLIKKQLEEIPINHPQVINYLKEQIEKGLKNIGAGKYSQIWRISYAQAYNPRS